MELLTLGVNTFVALFGAVTSLVGACFIIVYLSGKVTVTITTNADDEEEGEEGDDAYRKRGVLP